MRMAVDLGLFAISTASTISHLTAEQLKTVRYPAPPLRQQRAIADYLDRETARLDALVAVKVRVAEAVGREAQGAHHPRRHPRPRSSRPTPRFRRPLVRRGPGALASRAARISFAWDSAGVVSNLRQRASRARRMGRSQSGMREWLGLRFKSEQTTTRRTSRRGLSTKSVAAMY